MKKSAFPLRRKRKAVSLDELGGREDGGLAIVDADGTPIHMTTARVAAALRYFIARVQLHDSRGFPDRVSLTSALHGEGVTFITRSLASVLAYDTESSVVAVDLNWSRPRPDEEPKGLAGVVEHGLSVDDVLVKTSNPRLSLVSAGAAPVARRPALAGSDVLAATIDDIAQRFDHVLLDLPPLLASSEAMSLSQFADAFVLVVQQGATAESQVEAALEEMRGSDALGVVLNRFDSHIPKRLRRLVGA